MSDLRAEWKHFLAEKLNSRTPALVDVLGQLVRQPYPVEVTSLDFELFEDGFTDGFPARAFFMDADNCEFFVERDGKFGYPGIVDPELLDIECIFSVEEEEAFLDTPGADEFQDERWSLSAAIFIDWFEDCWRAAGGERFSRRATIMCHDEIATQRILATGAMS